jgi:SAM-dependent methyltransferase
VLGTDFSPAMVELARTKHPAVTFETADAESLHFGAGSFEAVTMGFLIGHLGRPAVAVREAWRVLRARGRLALAWWLPPARAVAFGIMTDAVRARGRVDVGLPPAPPFELFGDPQMLRSLFVESGFGGLEVTEVPLTWKIGSPEEMFDAYRNGTARTAGLLAQQTPVSLAAIRAEVIERCRPYVTPQGGLELPMPAHVVSGVKA